MSNRFEIAQEGGRTFIFVNGTEITDVAGYSVSRNATSPLTRVDLTFYTNQVEFTILDTNEDAVVFVF